MHPVLRRSAKIQEPKANVMKVVKNEYRNSCLSCADRSDLAWHDAGFLFAYGEGISP